MATVNPATNLKKMFNLNEMNMNFYARNAEINIMTRNGMVDHVVKEEYLHSCVVGRECMIYLLGLLVTVTT